MHAKHAIGTYNDGPVDNILQLADIARPIVGAKQFEGPRHRLVFKLPSLGGW